MIAHLEAAHAGAHVTGLDASPELLTPPFAVFCTFLLAFSPPAVVYAKELKQYSTDAAATCAILFAIWAYLEHGDKKHFVWLLIVFAGALPLSYTATLFVPLALYVLIQRGARAAKPWERPTGFFSIRAPSS